MISAAPFVSVYLGALGPNMVILDLVPRACGADLVKQGYNFKSVGQRSGSCVKVG